MNITAKNCKKQSQWANAETLFPYPANLIPYSQRSRATMSCTVKYRLHFCFPVYLFVIQRPSQNDTTAIFKKFRICMARNASIGLPMHEVYPKCFRTRIYKKG